ncbi:restriction endonuclease subunit S [Schleiferilactobacillus harbinensis]|uniref:restriction endonuclease subunit S n=1 Tax=Schleiferilactobacillus harbinensis TaxID=304207 RepID=UPI0021A7C641|nr:restriction endonuclease subunit S [Schleiferilactobacillus harbinensis]MCT2909866.1 restriction endonuclease subunit S [Schleiferilactobacillus harbinensis]
MLSKYSNQQQPDIIVNTQNRCPKTADYWEQRQLSSIATFNPKGTLPENFEYVDLESVVGTSLVSHRAERRKTAPSRAQRLAQKGDIFYQTVRPYQKNNYLFSLTADNYVFSTGYAQLRPKIDNYFLFSCLQEEHFVSEVLDRSTGTSYPAINSKDLGKIHVSIPISLSEQQEIGSMFLTLDRAIALHQRSWLKPTVNKNRDILTKMVFVCVYK